MNNSYAMEPGKGRKVAIEETEPLGCDVSKTGTLTFSVSLPSGQCAKVVVGMNGTVSDVKMAAQRSLGRPFLRFATSDGRVLESNRISSICWGRQRRLHCCHCTTAKDSCNTECVCFVVRGL